MAERDEKIRAFLKEEQKDPGSKDLYSLWWITEELWEDTKYGRIAQMVRANRWDQSEHERYVPTGYRVCDRCGRPVHRPQLLGNGMRACKGSSEWWCVTLQVARTIAGRYNTRVGLRQLHYRIWMEYGARLGYTNDHYKGLSRETAKARRVRAFPRLSDSTRSIYRPRHWEDYYDAQDWMRQQFRLDRTRRQKYAIYLGCEKRGLQAQLEDWFSDEYGIPIIPFGGTSSESIERDAMEDVLKEAREHDDREPILLYGGDWDASGMFILENFLKQTGCFPPENVVRVALNADQVAARGLPVVEGKGPDRTGVCKDRRWAGFRDANRDLLIAQGWDPVAWGYSHTQSEQVSGQVELDALAPDDLRALFEEALADFWDMGTYEAVLEQEEAEREMFE